MFTREEASALIQEANELKRELKMLESDWEDVSVLDLTESERSALEKVSRYDSDTVYTREDMYALIGMIREYEKITLLGRSDVIEPAIDRMYEQIDLLTHHNPDKSIEDRLADLKELGKEVQPILDADLTSLKRYELAAFLLAVLLHEHRLPSDDPIFDDLQQERIGVYNRIQAAFPKEVRYFF